jgi:hypothetical protein
MVLLLYTFRIRRRRRIVTLFIIYTEEGAKQLRETLVHLYQTARRHVA